MCISVVVVICRQCELAHLVTTASNNYDWLMNDTFLIRFNFIFVLSQFRIHNESRCHSLVTAKKFHSASCNRFLLALSHFQMPSTNFGFKLYWISPVRHQTVSPAVLWKTRLSGLYQTQIRVLSFFHAPCPFSPIHSLSIYVSLLRWCQFCI